MPMKHANQAPVLGASSNASGADEVSLICKMIRNRLDDAPGS